MIARLARIYLATVLTIGVLLLVCVLMVHLSVWMGNEQLCARFSDKLFISVFIFAFVSTALCKERNVWKNEFKACPRWAKISAIVLLVYALLVVVFQVFLFNLVDALVISVLPLILEAISLCLIYSIWQANLPDAEIVKRSGISLAFGTGIFLILMYRAQFNHFLGR